MNIGFIGTGNMGSAIIKGYLSQHNNDKKTVYAYDKISERTKELEKIYGINQCKSIEEIMKDCEVIILAVKPNIYPFVLEEISRFAAQKHIIVSIAAGITIKYMESFFDFSVKMIRTMPNTPALVKEGITALAKNSNISMDEFNRVMDIFRSVGKTESIDEKLMDTVTGVSGSSPAYVYMFIEALADGAVLQGMARNQAYQFAAQSILGAAKMVLETGKHPGELKDMVCSPGGTTIEAVSILEEKGMRSAVIEAVKACTEKSKKMSKE